MDERPVILCQGRNGVMSQTAAVFNYVAAPHIPEQDERSAAPSSGIEILSIPCTM